MNLEIVSDLERLEALGGEWLELWKNYHYCTPFQSPCWLIPWARRFSERLVVLVFRLDGITLGIAPFQVWTNPETRIRTLQLVGTGISDYLDVVCKRGCENAVIDEISRWIENENSFEKIDFSDVPAGSVLNRLKPRGWEGEITAGSTCPVLNLAGKGRENYAPPRQMDKLRYYRRRAAKEGDLRWESATKSDIEFLLEKLFELHLARWSGAGEGGVLGNDEIREFHREAARRLCDAGQLRVHGVWLNDKVISVAYGFRSGASTFYYLGGFDPTYEKFSPGMLAVGSMIELALDEGCSRFDFLRGEESYKYAWGAENTSTRRMEFYR